ncbi:hypothetical protein C0991_007089 [Blastosporella zonata]|nr:hypothetical protein C0991_007089 [Blastosporella zonata]
MTNPTASSNDVQKIQSITTIAQPAQISRREFLIKKVQQMRAVAMGDGIPRIPSPKEADLMRRETLEHIERILLVEDAKLKAGPHTDTSKLDDALFLTRAMYSISFPRTFRFNDLPPEIIANIFRLIVWPVPDPATGILWRLWLTWTCRSWREIAIGDITLWNAVWFRDRPPFKRSWAFIERAKSSTLDLRISSEDTMSISIPEMDKLLDQIIPNLPQIRILIYIGSSWEYVALLLDKLRKAGLSGIMPISLERLEIHRMGTIDYNTYGRIKPTALFDGHPAPRLHYLSLNGVHIDWSTPAMHNLSTLDIRKLPLELSPTITRLREIFTICPALRKLCLDGAGPRFDVYDPPPFPIVMAHLKILCISDFSAHYARLVFSHFTAPHLIDLTFINLTGEDYSPLYDILVNRFPDIKLLTMYAVDIVPRCKTMTRWFASLHELLYLRVANLPPSFFELFVLDPRTVISPDDVHPLPRVVLAPKLAVVESHPSVIRSLINFTAGRKNLGAPLDRIYITRPKEPMPNMDFQTACTQLRRLTSVYFMLNGTRTSEEDAILGE